MAAKPIRIPAQPLLDYVDRNSDDLSDFYPKEQATNARTGEITEVIRPELRADHKRNAEAVRRARETGYFDYFIADRICIDVLHLHPALVYGVLWWEAPEDELLQRRLAKSVGQPGPVAA